jgi:hypothetical protein
VISNAPRRQSGQSISAPQTGVELGRLIERRDELREQLESMNHQRAQLADQVGQLGSEPGLRAGPEARLKALDARLVQTESEIERSNELIAAARARGIEAEERGPSIHFIPPIPPIAEMPQMPGFAGFGTEARHPWQDGFRDALNGGLLITLSSLVLLGVFLYWRISRSIRQQLARLAAAQSGRLEEIQRSLDTVAVEVERVSENQRFVTKLVGERPAGPR